MVLGLNDLMCMFPGLYPQLPIYFRPFIGIYIYRGSVYTYLTPIMTIVGAPPCRLKSGKLFTILFANLDNFTGLGEVAHWMVGTFGAPPSRHGD